MQKLKKTANPRVSIVGGGLCGLTAAIRLAQRNVQVELFESAPALGGRTRSFFEPHVQQQVDNGPHLLSGAYQHTIALLDEAGASENIHWQDTLRLALWDEQRGYFDLRPASLLPLALALPLACYAMPEHGFSDITAIFKLARQLKQVTHDKTCVKPWLESIGINQAMQRDMLEPLCLGTMNEPLETANAASFARVLREAFANHEHARLGWFTRPLSEALIEPLAALAQQFGVNVHTGCRVRSVQSHAGRVIMNAANGKHTFDAAIIALPLRAARKLLGSDEPVRTRRISNIHMWFRDMPALVYPFIGGIGITGQWFFDISSQMQRDLSRNSDTLRHICCVISADDGQLHGQPLQEKIISELARMTGIVRTPEFVRTVSEHHATTRIAAHPNQALHSGLINAFEAPQAGELPATIESAVQRGQEAANRCYIYLSR